MTVCRRHYGAQLQRLNFARNQEGARRIINQWVESQTNNKIKDLLKEGSVSPDTRLILVNAVYFKVIFFNYSKTSYSVRNMLRYKLTVQPCGTVLA